MFAEVPLFPESASTLAPEVDAVFWFITAVSAFFTVLIAVAIIVFAIKYRRRSEDFIPTPIVGSLRLELLWTIVPLGIAMVIYWWSAGVFFKAMRAPEGTLDIFVVGRQWMWKVQHPDGQREINMLHVPVGRPVKLILTSEDVIHDFAVPAFRMRMDAIPGRYTSTWFEPTQTGVYHLFCAEYCGTEHSKMIGSIVVLTEREYEDWLSSQAEGSAALEGRKLFTRLQCITCHTGRADARGPSLEGLFGRPVPLADGRMVIADYHYLRESILQPQAKVVAGSQPIMPVYTIRERGSEQGQLTEDELIQLITYIRSLEPGQTPPRVEETPPPEARPEEEKKTGRGNLKNEQKDQKRQP